MSETTLYLRCRPGDVAARVLLTGDPARVHTVAEKLGVAKVVSQNREFTVVTGEYQGEAVSIVSSGIGAPSAAIALEELAQLGVKAVVRLGTMMGVLAPMSTVVLSTGAARFEGTSSAYLPLAYPAIPNWELVQTLTSAGRSHDLDMRLGLTATHDAFYTAMVPTRVGRAMPDLAELRQAGALAVDMETSLVHVLGMVLGIATAAMCLVTVQAEPHAMLDPDTRATMETRLINAALDGLIAFQV